MLAGRRHELLERARRGLVRDGHGDLRAEHVLLERGIEIVDCVEFDRTLREIDVGLDLAFLVMDLLRHDRWLAAALVAAYRDAGGDPGDDALVAFFAAQRALIRAKVALVRAGQVRRPTRGGGEARGALLALAGRLAWGVRLGSAAVVCGLAASGKSTLAASLAARAGATVVSSDAVRKRLLGIAASERAPEDAYVPEMNRRTYEMLGGRTASSWTAATASWWTPHSGTATIGRRSAEVRPAKRAGLDRVPRSVEILVARRAGAQSTRCASPTPTGDVAVRQAGSGCRSTAVTSRSAPTVSRKPCWRRSGTRLDRRLRGELLSRTRGEPDGTGAPAAYGRSMAIPDPTVAPVTAAVDVALRDGATVTVRSLDASDEPGLRRLLDGLSVESRTLRFFSAGADVHRAASYMAGLTPDRGRGLVAVTGDPERIVAHAAYVREAPGEAEVAFEVADAWQGRVSPPCCSRTFRAARPRTASRPSRRGAPDNRRMIQVFRDSGFAVDVGRRPGAARRAPGRAGRGGAWPRFEERDHVAAAAAVAHVLRPRSVAVIGVSTRAARSAPRCSGTCRSLPGRLHVVHPREAAIGGSRRRRSVAELPSSPSSSPWSPLPADAVVEVARQCAAKGVRALVVLSAGFAEVGRAGATRQAELLAVCRRGMRLIGPNCLGVLNTAAGVALNATFAAGRRPRAGRLRVAERRVRHRALARPRGRGLGLSSFVSIGNKADLSGNDLLRYWGGRPDTDVIAALPGVVRQPTPLRPDRAPRGRAQADRRRQERPLGRRRARRRRTPARCSRPPT